MRTDTKEKIIEIATELFMTKGYHATSIQEICEYAEVSKGGLFYYFKSKEDILVLIHEKFINYVLRKAEETYELYNDPTSILKKLIIDLVNCVGEYKPYVAVFFQERRFLSQEKFKSVKEKRDKYQAYLENTLLEGMKSGIFRNDLNHNIVAKAIFGMCDWLYQWYSKNGPLPPQEIGEIFWLLIIDGLKSDNKKIPLFLNPNSELC